jgi:hypothetical protein
MTVQTIPASYRDQKLKYMFKVKILIDWYKYVSVINTIFPLPVEEEYESGSEDKDKEICDIRDNSTKQESVIVKNDGASGLIYPIDIWFLIAHYIPVEKLCTFALICKGTYKVTRSVHLWKGLYRR